MTEPSHPWQLIARCSCCGLRIVVEIADHHDRDDETTREMDTRPIRTATPERTRSGVALRDRESATVFEPARHCRVALVAQLPEVCPRCHPEPATG